jgi:hypothetical protein
MLQRSSLPTTSPAEIADSLGRTLERPFGAHPLDSASLEGAFDGRRWRALQNALPLPTTWQQYLLACLAMAIVVGGMCLQVLLSVEIADREFVLRQLRSDYARVERQNSELVYAIAQQSSLGQMARLAAQSGYVPATSRTYIVRRPLDSAGAPQLASLAGELAPAPPAVSVRGEFSTPVRSAPAPAWLDGARQWWQELQESVTTAGGQLWRDFTGRME